MALTAWIRLVATAEDRQLIEMIAEQDGGVGMSAAVRRLIRDEAKRRNLKPDPQPQMEQIEEMV